MKLVILQIKDVENCKYAFMSSEFAKKNGFDLFKDYYVEFCGTITKDEDESIDEVLDRVFRYFNRVTEEDVERLEEIGFTGRSLSVSDIVSLDGEEYYCDIIGWTKIER